MNQHTMYATPPVRERGRAAGIHTAVAALAVLTVAAVVVVLLGRDDRGGEIVEGDGYSYAEPSGWSEAAASGSADTKILPDESLDARLSVRVEALPEEVPPELYEQLVGDPTAFDGTKPGVTVDAADIDGTDAVRASRTFTTADGVDKIEVVLAAIHDDRFYGIDYSTEGADDDAMSRLNDLIDGWRWG